MRRVSFIYISELPKIGIAWWSYRVISATTAAGRGK
jgi:hypothetical protein